MAEASQSSKSEGSIVGLVEIFLFGGFAISVLKLLLIAVAEVIWSHVISSPIVDAHFSTLTNIAILIFSVIFYSFACETYALITAAITAAIGYTKLKCLPLWYLLVMLPLCTVAICIQSREEGYMWSEIDTGYVIENLIPIFISYCIARLWLTKKKSAA